MKRHNWYYKNWHYKELKARDDALRRVDLPGVIHEKGMEAAKELHDKIVKENPVPEPDPTVVCEFCSEPYNETTRLGECPRDKVSKTLAWICKGCLVKAGYDPDAVSESCVGGRSGKITCEICGSIQHGSWFKHVVDPEVIERVRAS